MSETKFKVSNEVMEELNGLKDVYRSIIGLMDAIKYDRNESEVKSWIGFVYPNYQLKEQAIIDYCIWNKPTIELEREPHYVVYCDSVVIGLAVFYLSGGRIPVDFIESTDYEEDLNTIQYEEGWAKEDAKRLNETIKGKLVEVK